MKRNVTIVLDEGTARWVRIEAAKHDTSVSQYLAQILVEHRRRVEGYDAAMARYFDRPAQPLKAPKTRYPKREELHDRKTGS